MFYLEYVPIGQICFGTSDSLVPKKTYLSNVSWKIMFYLECGPLDKYNFFGSCDTFTEYNGLFGTCYFFIDKYYIFGTNRPFHGKYCLFGACYFFMDYL